MVGFVPRTLILKDGQRNEQVFKMSSTWREGYHTPGCFSPPLSTSNDVPSPFPPGPWLALFDIYTDA